MQNREDKSFFIVFEVIEFLFDKEDSPPIRKRNYLFQTFEAAEMNFLKWSGQDRKMKLDSSVWSADRKMKWKIQKRRVYRDFGKD